MQSIYQRVVNPSDGVVMPDVDNAIRRAIGLLERVDGVVRSMALFSDNEEVDDINTADLR